MRNEMHYELMATQSVFKKTILEEIAKTCPDLSPGQPKVLAFLMAEPHSIQCEIAEGCFIEPPTLTNILAKMEAAGLIERVRNHENRRTVTVSLSEKGYETAQKVKRAFAIVEARALKEVGREEEEFLIPLLKKLRSNLLKESANA
ncbi:DNA-binding transcriptional regulator, MarR family [Desulfatibacillum alkenivorans DSM 16219]|jgi:DNA-binding MarR family transcriptional regulator|uniref:DNA-binding transcriptional regulator, MarR family n=1 Tax=Desulfatibacillum alkenivorans DSM 16219 TaxID=1121393 RepID=A0A1M6BM88_9BACT|nr:MarR family transcriptional regulator [Desulfatibacillum alkenivorans]SHI49835.1 DNA-binding transcriptional regulator, MarR family [Desulfatibacillum alkenivorans DSM 16219]